MKEKMNVVIKFLSLIIILACIVFGLVSCLLIALSPLNTTIGCTKKVDLKENKQPSFKYEKVGGNHLKIYIDKETGVNYIVYDGYTSGGITVRLNADGTPYVSEEFQKK